MNWLRLLLLIPAFCFPGSHAAVTVVRPISTSFIAIPVCPAAMPSQPDLIVDDTVPRPIGYVNDYDSLFTTAQEYFLDSLIARFEQQTSIQIAVVTVDTAMTSKENFDNYVLRVLRVWGVGQEEKKNGIVVAISRPYRKMRIENGYGILKVLPDRETKMIIDTAFIPLFKKGEYFEGTLHGVQTLMERLRYVQF